MHTVQCRKTLVSLFFCLFVLLALRTPCLPHKSDRHSFPHSKKLCSPTQSSHVNTAKQSTSLCAFSGCVTLDIISPSPAVIQLSTTSVVDRHNVFSVFEKQMSPKTFSMTHTTYAHNHPWKYPSHTHYSVKKYWILKLGTFKRKCSQEEISAIRTSHSILGHTLRWVEEENLTFKDWNTFQM